VSGDPLHHYKQWSRTSRPGPGLLLVDFELQQYWLPGARPLALTAIYFISAEGAVYVSVTDETLDNTHADPAQQYAAWAGQHGFAQARLGSALALAPTYIAKPWGQEIWYTGVEERGVCALRSDTGETPLPWLQMVMPGEAIGQRGAPLILLKILDPVAQSVTGDLYFELHEEKREVYVVTHVDPGAWPDGTGYIRFGFSADKRAEFGSADDFRAAYLAAVSAYEQVRRAIDEPRDGHSAAGPDLARSEQELRREMDSFTGMKPLKVGDVIKVPLLTPHSLQHGVRTIEFQTPVFERKILSFAQQVVTQDHWDTPEAVAQMQLEAPEPNRSEVLCQEEGLLVERIVDFSDFEVQRVRLADGRTLDNPQIEHYALAIVVQGSLAVAGATYQPEQALLLPRAWQGSLVSAQPAETLVFLLAFPCN
jgi:hypothetical protein